ncbi:MAG: DNA topoisomerase IV subunit A [Myxococcales bacterium]|nr:DNA topoisomerase IV subunit A [Myxococcales bacterium]
MATPQVVEQVPLHQATSERYLSYALSVITSRALPDVHDGLKPVQRRILYAMFNDMSLHPGGRYRKCAAVVGEVMGKYHPHGDSAIYEALVRMAQDFTLRNPLIDGQGNFGSLDGDPPAAMRYTECKLRPLAEELISEIKKRTVDFRPNYDGQRFEPLVLPAQFPHLLVMGCEGIAVGMATKIPPHNLGEVIDAAVALIDDPSLEVVDLLRYVKGPDFPTAGQIVASAADLQRVYEKGQGSLKVRATWFVEPGRRRKVVLTSIPYGQNKSKLVEHVGAEVNAKRLPQVMDVRDESTDEVRIVLDLKQGASPEAVMAYLFKRTNLQSTWPVNLTALIPAKGPDGSDSGISAPARLDLKQILWEWLQFRFQTVRRRYEFDLEQLRERIHVLEGFAILFDALDMAIELIRNSDGKRDAAEKLIAAFKLTEIQADAILELRLYKISKLEITAILEELADKRTAAAQIEQVLASDERLWAAVRSELLEVRKIYADPRKTVVGLPQEKLEFDEDAYIVNEDAYVVVTRDGWIKRQSSFSDISKIRIRDDDSIGWLFLANTRSTVTFFTSQGSAYVMRVDAVPATTGYGEPLSANFSFADGERVVGVVPHDARHRLPTHDDPALKGDDDPDPPHGIAVTLRGRILRFPIKAHTDVSTRSGRKYARLNAGDHVFATYRIGASTDRVCLATRGGRATSFSVLTVPVLKAPGKGVGGIKVRDDDAVMAFELADDENSGPTVTTSFGRDLVVNDKFGSDSYGGRGKVVLKRGSIDEWHRRPALLLGPDRHPLDDADGGHGGEE